MIVGATSASYMPVADEDAADSDVGRYLLAVVSYTDAKRNVDDDGAFSEDARDKAGLVSVNPVAEDTRNRAPVFEDQDFEHSWHTEPDRDERGGGERQGQGQRG